MQKARRADLQPQILERRQVPGFGRERRHREDLERVEFRPHNPGVQGAPVRGQGDELVPLAPGHNHYGRRAERQDRQKVGHDHRRNRGLQEIGVPRHLSKLHRAPQGDRCHAGGPEQQRQSA